MVHAVPSDTARVSIQAICFLWPLSNHLPINPIPPPIEIPTVPSVEFPQHFVFFSRNIHQHLLCINLIAYSIFKRSLLGFTFRYLIALSSLMLLTQRITSTSLDIHEGKITTPIGIMHQNHLEYELLHSFLSYLSYMLNFPALFGGPLFTFKMFKTHVENLKRTDRKCITSPLWPFVKKCILFLLLSKLRIFVRNSICDQGPLQWNAPIDILLIWITALMFRLAYYSQWLLNESLNHLIGLGLENTKSEKTTLSDTDIWTLETTTQISEFARTWNKTTADWLRRIVFQRCKVQPLLATFAFSAWWHGLHPGQIFGFFLWALAIQADYHIHRHVDSLIVRSRLLRFFHRPVAWLQTQLVIAYILVAVELRSFTCVLLLCKSTCAICPLLYVLMLICMPNMPSRN